MRIGVLGNALLDRKTGIARYTYNLIKHLSILDDANYYFIFTERRDFEHQSLNLRPNFKLISNRVYLDNRLFRFCWEQVYLPSQVFLKRLNLFHSPEPLMPTVLSCQAVVTVYDLIYQHFPDTFEPAHLLRLKSFLPRVVRRAAKVITGSNCSKAEIVEYFGVGEKKVEVIYPGVAATFKETSDRGLIDDVKKKYHIEGNFILNVGVLDKRKNLARLIKALAELKKTGKISHKLVVCGAVREPLYQELTALTQELDLVSEVIFTDFVPDDDLALLYNAADLFIYPSLYEGFGLPVLEAMACGTPVITSNVSSLPEIAGGAAVLVKPDDDSAIARGIVEVLENDNLRQSLARKGLERAKEFTWQKAAQEHLAIYKEASKV